ncbi:MAG TPA: hypothetical protein VFI11_09535 [Anaerolineales bacterium]|nr:hypothetical protein [Anaerolineales bacterium]
MRSLRETHGPRDTHEETTASARVAVSLRRLGLAPWAAALIEALEPLALVGAQVGYLLEPVFGGGVWRDLASVLEDDEQRADLTARLHTD